MDLAFCPDERPRGFIVAGDECVDVGDEFWNALEGRAVERFAGQDREPDFNLVEPGGMCRGVMKPHVSVSLQPHVAFGLMGGEIIEDDMDFTRWMSGDDMVHEVQKLDAPSPFVVLADDCPAGEIECREERRRSMPFVVVRLPGHGAPVRKFQVTLRAFERLDRGLFVDRQYDGVLGRGHVEADDLGRLRHEVGIVAHAPRLAARNIDFPGAKKPPDVLDVDVAERRRQQRPAPVGVTGGRLLVEKRQNTRVVLRPVFGLGRSPASSRPAMRLPAKRTRHLDAVPIVQPTARAIARVAMPSPAIKAIRARCRLRCCAFCERARTARSERSFALNVIGVASGMLFMHP